MVLLFQSCNVMFKKSDSDVLLEKTEILLNSVVSLYEDSVFIHSTPKIITFVPDTGECANCKMTLNHWMMYKTDLEERGISCNVIFILNDSIKLNNETLALIENYKLHQSNGLAKLYRLNNNIPLNTFSTYLLDKDNHIRLVGNPVQNIDLWSLYRKTLREINSLNTLSN